MHVRLTLRLAAAAALLTTGPVLAGDLGAPELLLDVLPEADSILPSASGYFSTPIRTYASYAPSQAKPAAQARPAAPLSPPARVVTIEGAEGPAPVHYPAYSLRYRYSYSPYYYASYYSCAYRPWYYRLGRSHYYRYYSGLYDVRRRHYTAPYYHRSFFFPRSYYVRSYPSYFRLGLFSSGGHFSGHLRLP